MATLSFHKEGQDNVSDAFQGGKVIQLTFPPKGMKLLFVESRLGITLPWKSVSSKITECNMIVNVPSAGDGQEFRLRCLAEPETAEIIPMSSGSGSQPGPDTVGSAQIQDDAIQMEDLNKSVKDTMVTGEDRVTPEELDNFQP